MGAICGGYQHYKKKDMSLQMFQPTSELGEGILVDSFNIPDLTSLISGEYPPFIRVEVIARLKSGLG